ncbi:hypothetical protein [Thermotoga sp. Ku-13t]|uniref:hypothetical protein n=1 Tax=Thermotoga sp. Ku-13t TaxID=1755813 RepID=UPI0019D2AC00|nr:hypothetical protein [Thermotoga sp. Ku-13t]
MSLSSPSRENDSHSTKLPGSSVKGYLSPLKYVQSGFKVEGDKVALSLDTKQKDGVRQVGFQVSHRPDVEEKQVRELSITYDKVSGRTEARLVVEMKAREISSKIRV